jgi:hypothetical protein
MRKEFTSLRHGLIGYWYCEKEEVLLIEITKKAKNKYTGMLHNCSVSIRHTTRIQDTDLCIARRLVLRSLEQLVLNGQEALVARRCSTCISHFTVHLGEFSGGHTFLIIALHGPLIRKQRGLLVLVSGMQPSVCPSAATAAGAQAREAFAHSTPHAGIVGAEYCRLLIIVHGVCVEMEHLVGLA